MRFKLRLRNASQLIQICRDRSTHKSGKLEMNNICLVENGSIVIGIDGRIFAVGAECDLATEPWYSTAQYDQDIDCTGKCILPGFIDAHTHPVWDGDRVNEFEMKLAGATYMDIHKSGGGIGYSVDMTRKASFERLEALFLERAKRFIRHGTVCIEAKSGYGLETETEMKMLRVLHGAREKTALDISATFLGAHSVPKGSTSEQATRDIIDNQIPELVRLKQAGEISPENVDVFLEAGVFNKDEARQILLAGAEAGLKMNFHGDELTHSESAELGSELNATAISHLEEISDAGIAAMARKQVVAVLLPTTAYVLRIAVPPARKLVDSGVPVALGSDFNPNAHCLSMAHVMNLACTLMRMTMNEALVAATLNAAASINRAHDYGSLEVGKWGNIVVLGHADWRHLVYEMVDPPIESVWIRGELKHQSTH